MNHDASHHAAADWISALAEFLQSQPGVEAVKLDPTARTVSVATLGQVDLQLLDQRLTEVIAALEEKIAALPASDVAAPSGFQVRREGEAAVVSKQSCATAPRFWKWREFQWPEPAEEEEEEDWRVLAGFATACWLFGTTAFVLKVAGVIAPDSITIKVLYGLSILAGGFDAAIDVWSKVRKGELDIHFLMLAVAAGASAIGHWDEAALLLFLFSASGAMEAYALNRTHREVDSLLKAAPKEATRVDADGKQTVIKVEEIALGNTLFVKPGESFPADGLVTSGKTAADEANLTGEARPVEKAEGDQVFSGTINLWGAVEFSVQRLPAESTLQRIIRLIQTAQKLKAPSERFTDKFGVRYTYAVLGATAAMFFVWWLGFGIQPFDNLVVDGVEVRSAFYRAMTLLVVASPCALVLSIPSAILAAIAWGAKHGILFRGGAAIEKLADVDLVSLDKTGTLTTGDLEVVGYESFPPGREQEVLELAFSLEQNSQHPIARAITAYGRKHGVTEHDIAEFQSITGHGLKAKQGDATIMLGRRELLHEGPLAGWIKDVPPAPPELSEVWVIGKGVIGRVLLKDEVRTQSKSVLAEMKRLGLRTVMLTGDRRQAAESVAKDLGLDEVRAGLTPEAKVAAIQEFRAQGRKVAMVGDGVNDAPSLAAAFVSVAMGARGSDAALEQSEVVLMNDKIENFLSAYRLSQRARRVIKQNLIISLGTVIVMVGCSMAGIVPLTLGVFAHEGSTVVVCLNGLRLLFGKDRA
ncbi:MAG TPA: cation-translocating P-type ATPase [Opitutaceae bacterium]|nr:cation-translocating P-type ATPase [Opitutaceae bacterium]